MIRMYEPQEDPLARTNHTTITKSKAMVSFVQRHAGYGILFLCTAVGWMRRCRHPNGDTSSTTLLLWATPPWLWTGLGAWWLVRALTNIRVGVTRSLGTILESSTAFQRRLGFLERWYVAHSRAGVHTGFLLALELEASHKAATTALSSTSPMISMEDMWQTLHRVSQRFAWLRVKVKRDGVQGIDSRTSLGNSEDGKGVWGDDLYLDAVDANNPTIDSVFELRQVQIDEHNGSDFQQSLQHILEEESVKEWHDEDPNQCLWRAILVTGPSHKQLTLILAFHHLICDGLGAVAVSRAILAELNNDQTPVSDAHDNLTSNRLAPPMEDLMDTVPTLGHLILPLLYDRFPRLESFLQPSHWQGLTTHDEKSLRHTTMACLTITLDPSVLSTLRRNKITVNSFLVATLCQAIARVVGQRADNLAGVTQSPAAKLSSLRFQIQVAKSERAHCGLAAESLGVYLSGPRVTLCTTGESDCQTLAARFQQRLRAVSSARDIGLCAFINGDWMDFARRLAQRRPHGIGDSIEFSSLGRVSLDGSDVDDDNTPTLSLCPWSVRRLWFAQGRRQAAAAIEATTVTRGSEICAVLSAFPQAVPRATLRQIADAWKQIIEEKGVLYVI